VTVPYSSYLAGSTIAGRTGLLSNTSVNNTITTASVSSKIRLAWSSGATADTFSGFALMLGAGIEVQDFADGEIAADIAAPAGAGVGPVLVYRMYTIAPFDGYMLREVTPGDPTSWQLYYYSDNSPETLTAIGNPITPSGGVTDYTDLHARVGFVGSSHYVKVWKGTEPAGSNLRTDSTKRTAAPAGVGVWGANASGEYAEFTNIKYGPWGVLFVAGRSQDSEDSTSGDTFTFSALFDAPKDTPLWVAVSASADARFPTISCTNLVVDATVSSIASTGVVKSLIVFRCHMTADITAGEIVVDYGAGTDLTNCLISVTVCGGASTFAGVDTSDDVAAANIATGILTPSFTNPYATSGTIYTVTKANTALVTDANSFLTCGNSSDGAPSTTQTSFFGAVNDTDLTASWTGSVRRIAIGAEVRLAYPATEYTADMTASDAGAGAETRTVVATLSAADTGAGVDVGTVDAGSVLVSGSDTSTAAEASPVAIALAGPADSAVGTEGVVTVAASLPASDAATTAEGTPVAVALAGPSDTGTVAEAATVAAVLPAADTAAAAETASSISAALPGGTDAATGTEGIPDVAQTTTDTATLTDVTALLAAVLASLDVGTGTEASPVAIAVAGPTDSGAGSDTGSVTQAVAGSDAGSTAETATLAAAVPTTDTATAAETAALAAALTVADTATLTEAILGVLLAANDSGTLADTAAALAALLVVVEAATMAEAASIVAALTATESATFTDLATVSADVAAVFGFGFARDMRVAAGAAADRRVDGSGAGDVRVGSALTGDR